MAWFGKSGPANVTCCLSKLSRSGSLLRHEAVANRAGVQSSREQTQTTQTTTPPPGGVLGVVSLRREYLRMGEQGDFPAWVRIPGWDGRRVVGEMSCGMPPFGGGPGFEPECGSVNRSLGSAGFQVNDVDDGSFLSVIEHVAKVSGRVLGSGSSWELHSRW